jgi:uncharacterized protein (DUF2164 family)
MKQPKSDSIISETARKQAIKAIIAHFLDERDEEIGMIAAEELLDSILDTIAHSAYNRGLHDAEKLLAAKFDDLVVEIGVLKKDEPRPNVPPDTKT